MTGAQGLGAQSPSQAARVAVGVGVLVLSGPHGGTACVSSLDTMRAGAAGPAARRTTPVRTYAPATRDLDGWRAAGQDLIPAPARPT